jgi:hypothetical protein
MIDDFVFVLFFFSFHQHSALSHVDAVTDVVGEHRFTKAIDALAHKLDTVRRHEK